MKIKLTQPGFETYSGQMGVLFFENGLTTADVKSNDAWRLAAQFLCEWEDGSSVSVAQSILDHANTSTNDLLPELTADQALAQEAQAFSQVYGDSNPTLVIADTAVAPDAFVEGKIYTEEELGAVADENGIAGMRAIADTMGIKGNSIAGLIADILAKQAA